jgi:hypothetical protein
MPRRIEPGTPLRVGVFSEMSHADRAVDRLLAAGFTKDQLTVVCSDDMCHRHFKPFEHQQPAGQHTPVAAATGSALGVLVGSATAIAATLATGGTAMLISGALGAWTGAVVGGLVGAMMTRGVEHELADYYDQAVSEGKILVAVDEHGPQALGHLSVAERILAEAGALPLPLRES